MFFGINLCTIPFFILLFNRLKFRIILLSHTLFSDCWIVWRKSNLSILFYSCFYIIGCYFIKIPSWETSTTNGKATQAANTFVSECGLEKLPNSFFDIAHHFRCADKVCYNVFVVPVLNFQYLIQNMSSKYCIQYFVDTYKIFTIRIKSDRESKVRALTSITADNVLIDQVIVITIGLTI